MINKLRRPKYWDERHKPEPLPPEAIQEPTTPPPLRLRRPEPPAKKKKKRYWTKGDERYFNVMRAKVEQLTADNLLLKNRVAELMEIVREQNGLPVPDGWVELYHSGRA